MLALQPAFLGVPYTSIFRPGWSDRFFLRAAADQNGPIAADHFGQAKATRRFMETGVCANAGTLRTSLRPVGRRDLRCVVRPGRQTGERIQSVAGSDNALFSSIKRAAIVLIQEDGPAF